MSFGVPAKPGIAYDLIEADYIGRKAVLLYIEMVGTWCFGCCWARRGCLMGFLCSGVRFCLLLGPYLCFVFFSSFCLCAAVGGGAFMGWVTFARARCLFVLVCVWARVGVAPLGQFSPSGIIFLLAIPRRYFFVDHL